MSAIAEELDAKLRTLDARAASSLEKLVRDALELVETQNGTVRPDRLPRRSKRLSHWKSFGLIMFAPLLYSMSIRG